MSRTRISVAPTSVNSSITTAILFFSTIELTATQPSSSKALMVGALFPGVITVAFASLVRSTLYWQSTNFCAAIIYALAWRVRDFLEGLDILITPRIRDARSSTNAGFEGFFDLTRMAVLDTTVSIAIKPAAFMVSPDSKTVSHCTQLCQRSTYQRDRRFHLLHPERMQPQHFH